MNLFQEFLAESTSTGTYLGVRFAKETMKAVKEAQEINHIKNAIPSSELHCTLIYDENKPSPKGFEAAGIYSAPILGTALNYDLWGNDKKTLVLLFNSPRLMERHNFLVKTFGFDHGFSVYQPHVTLSYDVGEEFEQNDLHQLIIPDTLKTIAIIREYQEPLNKEYGK